MKIQETSEDIIKGGIMFPSPNTYYMEANTQRDEETSDLESETTPMRPGHAPCGQGMAKIVYSPSYAPEHAGNGP